MILIVVEPPTLLGMGVGEGEQTVLAYFKH